MSAPGTTTTVAARSKENPYINFGFGKCYRCGEPGNRSNEHPKRKQVNVVDYGDEDGGVAIEDARDSDFVEEHGDPIACVVQICSTTRRSLTPYNNINSFV